MQLKRGILLQGGKYRIEKVLGQGGFGITYLATQDILNRKVAIKEFFFKEFCEREDGTNTITLGTQSNKATVEKFLKKFIKEAQTISALHHPNIVQIHDIFRENNTAYYVMEYIDGESLGDIVKIQGALPETKAVEIIKKVAVALDYIHTKNINHLDVKPNNIMVRHNDGEVILIDFGVAKQYDETTKEGTTTTPVGISHGYSPSEQYKRNGVSSFSPESDIYSLGATLYKLVTGITPPEAIEVAQEGLPKMPSHISYACKSVIRKSMMLNKADRPHNIAQFLNILNSKSQEYASISEEIKENAELTIPVVEIQDPIEENIHIKEKKKKIHIGIYGGIIAIIIFAIVGISLYKFNYNTTDKSRTFGAQTKSVDYIVRNFEYKDTKGKLVYYWNGSVDKNDRPVGKGKAIYPSNDKDERKSYVGEMMMGLRTGNNDTLRYTNGNVYIGSFDNDHLSNGRLDLISDDMYYIGSFKNDSPYNGKWYYTNGNLYSIVENGVEK